MTKKRDSSEDSTTPPQVEEQSVSVSGGVVPHGANQLNQVPPSVVGTSHDPKRKKED